MKRPGSRKHGTKKVLGLVMVVGIIAAGTYAFTNSNTVPDNNAGDGSKAVSGYTVGSLDYNETEGTDTDPSTIESVDFTLNGPATRVRVQLSQATGKDGWFDCATDATAVLTGLVDGSGNVIGTGWKCATNGYAALDVTNFRVLAYNDSNSV